MDIFKDNWRPVKKLENKEKKVDTSKYSNKSDVIRTLQIIYENSDSKSIRISCLKIVSYLDRNNKELYEFFENAAISDLEKRVRFKALKLIIKNYTKKGVDLFKHLSQESDSRQVLVNLYESIVYNIRHIKNEVITTYKAILDEIDARFYELTEEHINRPYKW